jgi:hypothetical protein
MTETERLAPLEVVGRTVVAGGERRCHRAWPGAEVAANGDLVVAYKEGSTHHRVDDEVVFVTRSASAAPGSAPLLLWLSGER